MGRTFEFDLVTAFDAVGLNISAEDFRKAVNKNEFYSGADLSWMMTSSALVLLMVPGLALFYSGMSDQRSHISMMWLSVMTTSLIGIQWYLWGFSITFSGSNTIWGGSDSFVLHSDLTIPYGTEAGTKIPELVYALYQGMFACFTGAVISGAAIRKGRPLHFLVFIFIWTTFVYDPIARSTWNSVGWSNYWKGETSGVFDFAGGTVVHIVSATTAAVYSIFCSKWRRQIFGTQNLDPEEIMEQEAELREPTRPQNTINVILGTVLLWVGWFGFNGGSALGANLRAVSACISTQLAACAGGLMGTVVDYYVASSEEYGGRFSVLGFCNGVVAGLVAITPAAGYVPCWSAPIFGIVASILVTLAQEYIKTQDYFFDYNDIFVVHGIAGWVGMLLTAALARASIAALDGYTVIINHKWEQFAIQLADGLVGMLWAGVGTFIILCFQEAIIVGFRKWRGTTEPPFKLIRDSDFFFDDLEDETASRRTNSSTGAPSSGINGHANGSAAVNGTGLVNGNPPAPPHPQTDPQPQVNGVEQQPAIELHAAGAHWGSSQPAASG